MFAILTHDNQSALSSFRLFQIFVKNSTAAEKALSASTDVGWIVLKAVFQGYLTSSL